MINALIILTLALSITIFIIGLISLFVARIVAACYYKKQVKQKRHLRIVK